ncbi:hypothetical protein OO012_16035 [Rhodobacteraceae bacterium KMM 6894]|nr:hypothetical protein [Rhodobacteraceae bacterium KMM 6894]
MAIAKNYIGQEWTPASFWPENDGLSHGEGPALFGPVPDTDNPSQRKAFGPLRATISFVGRAAEAHIANDTGFTLIAGVRTNIGRPQSPMRAQAA